MAKPPASWDRLAECKIRERALLKSPCSPPPTDPPPLHPSKPPFPFHSPPRKKKSSSGSPQVSEALQQQDRLTSCAVLITSFPVTTILPPFLFLLQEHVLWWLYIVNGPYDLIVFRVNLECQIQLNPIVLLAPWNTFGKWGGSRFCLWF